MSLVGLLHHFEQFPVWWRWQSSLYGYVCLFVYAVRACVVSIALNVVYAELIDNGQQQ